MITKGISPKVLNPAILLFVAGIVLVILSALVKDDGALRDLGLGALGSAILAFGVGYKSPPGDLEFDPDTNVPGGGPQT